MPSVRRVKLSGAFLFAALLVTLFYAGSVRRFRAQNLQPASDFFSRTKSALDQVSQGPADEERLSPTSRPPPPTHNDGPETPTIGSTRPASGKDSLALGAKFRNAPGLKKEGAQEPMHEETEEEHEVEQQLNRILKKSPIIIFSKSYCPYSKQAKSILLEKYAIEPAPFVVELDQHPMGAGLQTFLARLTGRKTVPNVLINGLSIGGGDEVADLDASQTIIDKITELGGKRVHIKLVSVGDTKV